MEIRTWIKYHVGYLPTKRCRKLRYREEEDYVDIELKETTKEMLIPAFDNGIMIYAYDNRFWREAKESDIHCVNDKNPMTALEALSYAGVTYSTYFPRYYNKDGVELREDVIKRANEDMEKYRLVSDVLYIETEEPMYCIYTFGLGHNHAGIGTSLSNDVRFYNPNISKDRYFNALEYDKAISTALEIAKRRGDTDSFDYIKNTDKIVVYDKKFVKRNPQKEHGDGDAFINSIEKMIDNTESSSEAALLTIATCMTRL